MLRILTRSAHYRNMALSERRLPHLYVIGQPLFVTFRLHGSLPTYRAFPPQNVISGEAFVAMDRLLDQARGGPTFLRQPDITQLVMASIDYGAEIGQYETHAWVIVPNHVHLLLTPHVSVSKLLCSLKAATAKRANLLLERTGYPFWQRSASHHRQDESYDRLVRNGEESRRIQRYIDT